jgi:hypothetical protein
MIGNREYPRPHLFSKDFQCLNGLHQKSNFPASNPE